MQIQSAPNRPVKNWTLAGHINAASYLEMDELRHTACLQTIDPQDVNVVMEIRRKAYDPKRLFPGQEFDEFKETGRKIDLVIFDSCLMGNLEALSKLAPHAKYAVASEEIMYTGHRAWDLVFNDLGGAKGDPVQLGQAMVKQLGGHWEGRTTSLIDLEKLEPLKARVENLGDKVKQADTQAAVSQAQQALREAVVGFRNQMCYDHCQGLSVRVPTHNFGAKTYLKKTGMEKWGQLMSEMRPAPRDRTIINHRSIL